MRLRRLSSLLRTVSCLICLGFLACRGVAADPASVVLTIGQGDKAAATVAATFTDAQLMALPQHTYRVKFPWEAQEYDFSGPLLRDVLQAAKVDGGTLKISALNGYSVEMPRADSLNHDLIVACRRNNAPLRIREKGPLILVYPFNTQPDLRTEIYYARCVWQVSRIDVSK